MKANMPIEPPMVVMLSAKVRRFSGASRLTAPSTTANFVPLSPSPIRSPMLT